MELRKHHSASLTWCFLPRLPSRCYIKLALLTGAESCENTVVRGDEKALLNSAITQWNTVGSIGIPGRALLSWRRRYCKSPRSPYFGKKKWEMAIINSHPSFGQLIRRGSVVLFPLIYPLRNDRPECSKSDLLLLAATSTCQVLDNF